MGTACQCENKLSDISVKQHVKNKWPDISAKQELWETQENIPLCHNSHQMYCEV